MRLETAIMQIQKDAKFLGMTAVDLLKFIEKSPLAQTQKTLEAYKVIKFEQEKQLAKI